MSIASLSSNPERVRVHLYISGKVQGVFYRASAERVASSWGLAGWVRNLPDGRVELVAEGDRPQVEALILWCREGPPEATVTAVELSWETPQQDPSPGVPIFQIRR
ncbi:MAG: acylphosphatase [Prochlorotrichaceae cyanobacterium]|jgi:acylphosphatase